MSDRNEFTCTARGCDGCTVCAPEKAVTPVTDVIRIQWLHEENARLREALKKIADGGAGIGELATPVERMIRMSEIAQDALEGK